MCKGLSNDAVGVSRDTVFEEVRPGAGFETGDFVKERLGGATVERLSGGPPVRDLFLQWLGVTRASNPVP